MHTGTVQTTPSPGRLFRKSQTIDLTVVRNVLDVSTVSMKNLLAHSLLSVVSAMGNAHVLPASEEMTALNRYADPWQMEKTDLPDKASTATVRRVGRA